jgi:hypothetical protein
LNKELLFKEVVLRVRKQKGRLKKMTNENVEKAKADQSDSDLELKDEESYREFLCRHEHNGKECGFRVRAKTDDEVIKHARYASGNGSRREGDITRSGKENQGKH